MSDLVVLRVGRDGTKYPLTRKCACDGSPLLRAAFESGDKPTSTYTLDKVGKHTVFLLREWLVKHDVVIAQRTEPTRKDEEDKALIELWILGGKLKMPALQNKLIRNLDKIARATRKVAVKHLTYIWENTAAQSPLRRFYVDMCASKLQASKFAAYAEDFPHEMLIELATEYSKAFAKLGGEAKKSWGNIGNYLMAEEK